MLSFLLNKIESLPHRKLVKDLAEAVFPVLHTVCARIPGEPRCPVCGARLIRVSRRVMGGELLAQWNLDSRWIRLFDQREGEICISCGASLRVRQLALALIAWANQRLCSSERDLKTLFSSESARSLKVAEINSCGALHKALHLFPGLAYSEFEPESKNVRHEDLQCLSYRDESFDLVLHSDTLEHVPDIAKALRELWRVLKPNGTMLCTIPMVRDGRRTLKRAEMVNGQLEHLLPPSYHGGSYQSTRQYLVCSEFGEDSVELFAAAGFEVTLFEHPDNASAAVLNCVKNR